MIILELTHIKEIKNIYIEFLPYMNSKLLIKIYYLPSKEYNPLSEKNVIFYIELNDKFPDTEPKLTCHSNVYDTFYNLVYLSHPLRWKKLN